MASAGPQCFEFAGFRLDGHRRLLLDPQGNAVDLPSKAYDTLVYLLEHAGELVERSALVEAVWPNTVVEDNNLSQAIAALRRALGPDVIATVPRRGYQFTPTPRLVAATRRDRSVSLSTITLAVVGFGTAAVVAVLLGLGRQPTPMADPLSQPKVAVLSCANRSPDPDDAYFAVGIHEEIVDRLAGLSALQVVPTASLQTYANTDAPISEIADELGATAVVDCSVRYAGSQIRVAAQLIDPQRNVQLWNETYEADLSDLDRVFAIQSDIATSIAEELDAELTAAETLQMAATPTASPEAYSFFLKARQEGFEERWRSETYFSYLDRAIEADPEFALVYALRARGRLERIRVSRLGATSAWNPERELELATEDVRRALELDPRVALGHVVAAGVASQTGNSAESRSHLERALELSPNDIDILQGIAGYYIRDYRQAAAIELLERAKQLDPMLLHVDEYFYYMAGDLDTAAERSARRVEVAPGSARAHLRLGNYEALRNNADVAEMHLRLAEELYAEDPDPLEILSTLVYAYGRIGLLEDAKRVFLRLEAGVERLDRPLAVTAWVFAYLGIGDEERAYERATELAQRPLAPYLSPQLEFVQNTAEEPALEKASFVELRRRLGYPE